MIPEDKVQEIVKKHDSLEKELSSEILIQNYMQKNLRNILVWGA